MHDTPEKGIFGDDARFVSSGCVRVQDVRDYVAWLLKDQPGWSRDEIDRAINSGQRVDVKLTPAVNVYWVYITGWASPDGVVQFRPDIYQRDGGPGPGPYGRHHPGATEPRPQGRVRTYADRPASPACSGPRVREGPLVSSECQAHRGATRAYRPNALIGARIGHLLRLS